MKKQFAIALLGTTLLAGAAFAQTATPPAAPAAPESSAPASPGPAPMDGAPGAAAPAGEPFIAQAEPSQWRASKFVGVNVYGPDNSKVGEISEVLIGPDGRALAAVVGVGGFLGIGQKDVALPFASLQFSAEPMQSDRAATSAPPAAGGTASVPRVMDYPDHAKITMTKEQLQNAPTFRYASAANDQSPRARASAPATAPATAPAR